ncbi:MAG: hypothetical protein GIKADHBN_00231 [Phycisphaerales bacterium]|nr:hypothetical protein [Phycisphaerales bacterium]
MMCRTPGRPRACACGVGAAAALAGAAAGVAPEVPSGIAGRAVCRTVPASSTNSTMTDVTGCPAWRPARPTAAAIWLATLAHMGCWLVGSDSLTLAVESHVATHCSAPEDTRSPVRPGA